MLEVAGERIFFGDFHCQWCEVEENLPIYLAGLTYYGYDFGFYNSGDRSEKGPMQTLLRNFSMNFKAFASMEIMYEWNHLSALKFEGNIPPVDDPDYKSVLATIHSQTKYLAMAHPYEPMIPKLSELLEEGLIDAVEFLNGGGEPSPQNPIYRWYIEELKKGKTIPIVNGLDVHVSHGYQRPDVIFNSENPPNQDIQLLDKSRTLVLCESCTEEAIIDAVKKCHTLVETRGQLVGPPQLVEKLEKNGYWKKRKSQQYEREILQLELVKGSEPVAGDPLEFKLNNGAFGGGEVIFFSGQKVFKNFWSNEQILKIGKVPHLVDKNYFFVPINVLTKHGNSRSFAFKIKSPVDIGLSSEVIFKDGSPMARVKAQIRNNTAKTLEGFYTLSGKVLLEPSKEKIARIEAYRTTTVFSDFELPSEPSRPVRFTFDMVFSNNMRRTCTRNLVFVACRYSEDFKQSDWDNATKIILGYEDQLDPTWTSDWRGSDDSSGEFSLLWNEQGMCIRGRIVDDVLCASPAHLPHMFGDSIQIAINPINREDVPAQSMYNLFLTRGTGNEEVVLRRGPKFAVEGIETKEYCLPSSFYEVKRISNTVTLCTLFLPWSLLIPIQPLLGYRFGLYIILWDNDGQGLKAGLEWPTFATRETGSIWYDIHSGAWAQVTLMNR